MGFFMKSTGVPEKVIEVMAHAGLSVSLSTIYNMVTSISKEISRDIKREAFAYDNFDIAFNVAQPTLEKPLLLCQCNIRHCDSLYGLWASDPKNPYTYNRQTNPTQLSGREEAFAWHIRAILVQHNQNFKHFADNLMSLKPSRGYLYTRPIRFPAAR
ncbi:uncharacterized protein F5147DRAFT_741279 [Suillus discolor]|uniref:Uncharacterized protein n=1 Tax=Suillus discolor TaxID=1912936 RepID=A0A9P7ER52_9AGAM|nr:uncharacterized protein F5147DRAFT_741279 [Suillus discolor]KAG2079458.1 hypothetical protein F5147DRAFT_741279 [Suillus discolor]